MKERMSKKKKGRMKERMSKKKKRKDEGENE